MLLKELLPEFSVNCDVIGQLKYLLFVDLFMGNK